MSVDCRNVDETDEDLTWQQYMVRNKLLDCGDVKLLLGLVLRVALE